MVTFSVPHLTPSTLEYLSQFHYEYAADETPLVYIPIRLLLTFKIRSLQPEFLSFKKRQQNLAIEGQGNLHCGRRGEKGDRGAFK